MDLGGWLRSLGLERYEAAFRENEIDEAVLPNLTAEDLKELGVAASGIAERCSMPSLLCAPMLARNPQPDALPTIEARPKDTASAAKSR